MRDRELNTAYVPNMTQNPHNQGYIPLKQAGARKFAPSLECYYKADLPRYDDRFARYKQSHIVLNDPVAPERQKYLSHRNDSQFSLQDEPLVPQPPARQRELAPYEKYEPTIYDTFRPGAKEMAIRQREGEGTGCLPFSAAGAPEPLHRRQIHGLRAQESHLAYLTSSEQYSGVPTGRTPAEAVEERLRGIRERRAGGGADSK